MEAIAKNETFVCNSQLIIWLSIQLHLMQKILSGILLL